MANPYRVTLRGVSDDGTNTYCEIEISDGQRTMQLVRPVFPTGTTAAAIQSYMQTIANNQPTISAGIQTLVNTPILGQ